MLGVRDYKLHFGNLGPENVSSQIPKPWLQFSQTNSHFLQDRNMNPVKSWNFITLGYGA